MSDNEEKRLDALFNKYYSDEIDDISIENDVSDMIGFMDSINDIKSCNYFRLLSKMKIEKFYESQYLFNDAINNWSKALGLLVYKVLEHIHNILALDSIILFNAIDSNFGSSRTCENFIIHKFDIDFKYQNWTNVSMK